MQVWNVLHAARWKYRTQKIAKKLPSAHHRTTLLGYIFATKARIDNPKKLLNSNISPHVLTCGAGCKYRTQNVVKKSPSGHHRTTLSGYIFATKARIDNRKKFVKQQYLLHVFSQYGGLRLTSGWDRSGNLRHPCKFQRVSHLGSVTARHSSIGCQPNFAALNRGRHLYSAGRPSRWALAHILVLSFFPRLISAVGDWMFTILWHMVWP